MSSGIYPAAAAAVAAPTNLKYFYGNQITQSEVDLNLKTGKYTAKDMLHGAGAPETGQLKPADLAKLKKDVAAAAKAPARKTDGGLTTFGSPSGYLRGVFNNGSSFEIVRSERNPNPGPTAHNQVTYANTPATARIVQAVDKLIDYNPMPTDPRQA